MKNEDKKINYDLSKWKKEKEENKKREINNEKIKTDKKSKEGN